MNNFISLLFFLSGITGLVYEVLSAKYLSLLLGNTAQAHTIVLATFLGGLALGNAIFGPQADKVSNRLRLYGWLELGIGLLALLSPLSRRSCQMSISPSPASTSCLLCSPSGSG
jgi:spermidine synthase